MKHANEKGKIPCIGHFAILNIWTNSRCRLIRFKHENMCHRHITAAGLLCQAFLFPHQKHLWCKSKGNKVQKTTFAFKNMTVVICNSYLSEFDINPSLELFFLNQQNSSSPSAPTHPLLAKSNLWKLYESSDHPW